MRYPFAVDAFDLGYLVGFREDGSFQLSEEHTNVDLDAGFLDNHFRDPDVNRYLEKFEDVDPRVAVIGDAYTRREAEQYQSVVDELEEKYPHKSYVVVPKCRDAFQVLDDEVVLGVPIGFSDLDPEDLGWKGFRGRDVHLLGGAPDRQWEAVQKLTQPRLDNSPPANIQGIDWNGFFRSAFAQPGEYWTPNGWKKDYGGSTRDTVRKSLEQVKDFWEGKEMWPETTPRDLHGPAVLEPDQLIFIDRGGDPIPTREALEKAYVDEYEGLGTLAFAEESRKNFFEYRSDWEHAL